MEGTKDTVLSPLEIENYTVLYKSICKRKKDPPTARLLTEFLQLGVDPSDENESSRMICGAILDKSSDADDDLSQDNFLDLWTDVLSSANVHDRIWCFYMALNVRFMEVLMETEEDDNKLEII